jgi:hypothetical protein
MKKILLFFGLITALISEAQFPATITSGNSSTLQKAVGAYGAAIGYVFAGTYGDTTAANVSFIKNVPGIVIRIGDDLWIRNNAATTWIKIGAGAGTASLTQYRLAIGDASNLLSTAAAITGNRALVSDANGVPTHASTTAAQINYLSTTTSDVQTQINTKEATFTETTQEFTGATSMSVTLSNTPKTGKAEMYFLNGIVIKQSNISRTGTSVALNGFTRESSDVITAKYSY